MKPLTASAIEAYHRCPALYSYQYESELSLAGYNSALVVGSAMHAAGESLRVGRGLEWAMAAASKVINDAQDVALTTSADPEALGRQVANDTAKTWCMINGYHDCSFSADLCTSRNEIMLKAPLFDRQKRAVGAKSRTFYLRGICDGVIERDSKTYLYEMKTCSETVDEALRWLRQSIQIPLYLYLLAYSGENPIGAIVDVIKKPIKAKRKGESPMDHAKRCLEDYRQRPKHFFARATFDYDEAAINDALRVAWRTAAAIRNDERNGYLALRGRRCRNADGWCRMVNVCWYDDLSPYLTCADRRYDNEKETENAQKTE